MAWAGRDLEYHLIPTLHYHGQGHLLWLLKSPCNLAFNTSRDKASTASLGGLCQGLTILKVENFFLQKNFFPFASMCLSQRNQRGTEEAQRKVHTQPSSMPKIILASIYNSINIQDILNRPQEPSLHCLLLKNTSYVLSSTLQSTW